MKVKERIDEIHSLLAQLDHYQWKVKGHTKELIKYREAEARLKHGWTTINGAGSVIVDETKKDDK